ncbi:DoxX family protein [Pedobacter sp. HMWF019]|uniref:DoxX family protein n=1 Tax=Pedobacter sp. HMWF019 TaxID=2056856 RepID=UPI000D36F34C|nr:DoxX family protein [Pedobacter sp. HMWF019]PTS91687.1 DoxX family protein [Pedobacter sp. HMWF019]
MKTTKITYYISTGLISSAMLFSAYAYLVYPQLQSAFRHLGFPDYFRIELAVAKLIAAIAIWFPVRLLKEASYIGLAISFVSAVIARTIAGDDVFHAAGALMALIILIVSYASDRKLSTTII